MCLSCGCGDPQDDHGDPRRVTLKNLSDIAVSDGISVAKVAKRIRKGVRQSEKAARAASRAQKRGTVGGANPGTSEGTTGAP
jgi:hypothetical protein